LERKKGYESCPCAEIEKKIVNIGKTVEEERDVRDRRDEAEDIIVASITNKIDKVEQKLEKLHHDQVNNSAVLL
jgi:hypothetical protein